MLFSFSSDPFTIALKFRPRQAKSSLLKTEQRCPADKLSSLLYWRQTGFNVKLIMRDNLTRDPWRNRLKTLGYFEIYM